MPPLQYWFTGTALATFLTFIAAISTLGYSWYRSALTELESAQNKIESAAQKAKNEQVKLLLGKALTSGTQLIAAQGNKDDTQAKNDAETWVTQIHNLIAAAYGDGEAALFLDDAGYVFYGGTRIRNWIDGRLRRISELLRRTDSLTVRPDFNPTLFE